MNESFVGSSEPIKGAKAVVIVSAMPLIMAGLSRSANHRGCVKTLLF